VSLAIRLLDLGRPEASPASLDSVLASGLADIYPALAVWLQGAIDPIDAWPIARSLADRAEVHGQSTRLSLQSVLAGIALQAGDATGAAELMADAARRVRTAPRLVRLFIEVTRALVDLDQVGEAACRDALVALLHDVPLGRWPERPYLFALTAIRALVPGAEVLDRCAFGPSLTVAVEAGAALVALRSGDARPASSLPWDRGALLRVHVPLPLLAELALGADAPGAAEVIGSLPDARRWLTRIAAGSHEDLADRAGRLLATTPHPPSYALSVTTLGRFELRRSDAVPTAGWDRRERVRHLLAVLVLRAPIERSAVGELLWPELDPDKRAANLRVNLAHLHQALEPDRDRADPTWFVRTPGTSLALDGETLTVDLADLEGDLAAGRRAEDDGRASEALDRYESAAARYRGELLPGMDEEWVIHERLRVRALAHNGVVRAGELRLAKGDPEIALDHAAHARQIEPLSERAHRLFVQANLAIGSIDTARRAARSMEADLARAGLDAEPETHALHARVGIS
jgi:DNA-binding SARP family transcriptional activator